MFLVIWLSMLSLKCINLVVVIITSGLGALDGFYRKQGPTWGRCDEQLNKTRLYFSSGDDIAVLSFSYKTAYTVSRSVADSNGVVNLTLIDGTQMDDVRAESGIPKLNALTIHDIFLDSTSFVLTLASEVHEKCELFMVSEDAIVSDLEGAYGQGPSELTQPKLRRCSRSSSASNSDDDLRLGREEASKPPPPSPKKNKEMITPVVVRSTGLRCGLYEGKVSDRDRQLGKMLLHVTLDEYNFKMAFGYSNEKRVTFWAKELLLSPLYTENGQWYRPNSLLGNLEEFDKVLSRLERDLRESKVDAGNWKLNRDGVFMRSNEHDVDIIDIMFCPGGRVTQNCPTFSLQRDQS